MLKSWSHLVRPPLRPSWSMVIPKKLQFPPISPQHQSANPPAPPPHIPASLGQPFILNEVWVWPKPLLSFIMRHTADLIYNIWSLRKGIVFLRVFLGRKNILYFCWNMSTLPPPIENCIPYWISQFYFHNGWITHILFKVAVHCALHAPPPLDLVFSWKTFLYFFTLLTYKHYVIFEWFFLLLKLKI